MPLVTAPNQNIKFPDPTNLTLSKFNRGVMTLVDQSNLPKNAAKEMTNLYLTEDGTVTTRPGVGWYGVALPVSSAIDGFDYFDFNGAIHLLAAAGGTIYRSVNDGTTWTACTGASYTAGHDVHMNQNNSGGAGGLFLTTGVDPIMVYDGTLTLITYTTLATPAAPTAAKTGLVGTLYTYFYKVSRVNKLGYSAAGAAVSIQTGLPRANWNKTTDFVTLTLPTPVTSQERMDVYFSEDGLNYYYLDSVVSSPGTPNVTYVDSDTAIITPSTVAPTVDTTQGPAVEELTNIGIRMFGVRDHNNRYRIWYTSGTPPYGAFSGAYDGGYLDWLPGGKFYPVKVEDYRDKSGAPIATIWCDSADGEGCVLQMSLDTTTVGNITVTTPSIYKLAGSRGTSAPGSVVNVLNDYMYYNSQAFYNMGSRAQFLNLLSTDESSANIRPTVRTINPLATKGIASTYFDAKVYFSVPYGSATSNSHTIIYDTERKAWLPSAFTLGFKKFVRYTSADGHYRLLAVKQGDNRLSEISPNTLGDYGVGFQTTLITGLYPTDKDRFEFQFTEEAEFELTNPQGTIYFDLIGIERSRGYSTIKSRTFVVSSSSDSAGWDTFNEDTSPWDNTFGTPVAFSESSVKRYFTVQKEMNAVQWRVTTNTVDSRYTLRTLQTWGTPTKAGHPSKWRLKT